MQIAVQLWVFNKLPERNERMPELLAALAADGYTAIEAMGGQPPFERAEVEQHGLTCLAIHYGTAKLEPLTNIIAEANAIGAERVVASGPRNWHERTAEAFHETAITLNSLGRRLRDEANLTLLYHNHEFEFMEVEPGRNAMQVLSTGLEPNNVLWCFDSGWAWFAGADPVAFLRENRERIGVLHLRDFKGKESVPLGQGELDLKPILAEVPHLPNLHALVVEQDPTTSDPSGDSGISRRYLREVFGL